MGVMNLLVDQHCTTLTDSLLNTELELVRCVGAQVQCVGLLATTEKVESLCLLVDSRILFGKYRVERIESYIPIRQNLGRTTLVWFTDSLFKKRSASHLCRAGDSFFISCFLTCWYILEALSKRRFRFP